MDLDEIRENDHNLSIPLYVAQPTANGASAAQDPNSNLTKALSSWLDSSAKLRAALAAVIQTQH